MRNKYETGPTHQIVSSTCLNVLCTTTLSTQFCSFNPTSLSNIPLRAKVKMFAIFSKIYQIIVLYEQHSDFTPSNYFLFQTPRDLIWKIKSCEKKAYSSNFDKHFHIWKSSKHHKNVKDTLSYEMTVIRNKTFSFRKVSILYETLWTYLRALTNCDYLVILKIVPIGCSQ